MGKGYRRIKVGGRYRLEHLVVWEAINGPRPKGWNVHHKNEDKADNRPSNLKLVQHGAHISLHHAKRPWLCSGCRDPTAIHAAFGLCKPCYDSRYRLARRDELRSKKRVDYLAKWEQRKAKARAYYEANRERLILKGRAYYRERRAAAVEAGVIERTRTLRVP